MSDSLVVFKHRYIKAVSVRATQHPPDKSMSPLDILKLDGLPMPPVDVLRAIVRCFDDDADDDESPLNEFCGGFTHLMNAIQEARLVLNSDDIFQQLDRVARDAVVENTKDNIPRQVGIRIGCE